MSIESTNPDVKAISDRFKSKIIKVKEFRGQTFVCIDRKDIVDVIAYLKENPKLNYDYFVECVGVDYSTWTHERDLPGRFEVVYNLYSTSFNRRLFVKVSANDGESISSIKHLFLGAEYPEREIQDLYGIPFEGNPEPSGMRFLLPDTWVGFPLRKEFPLGGEDVVFHDRTTGPAIEDLQVPHAGESFEGKTGSNEISKR